MKKISILALIATLMIICYSCAESNDEGKIVSIQAYNNLYICVDGENNGVKLIAKSEDVGDWETFTMITVEGMKFNLKANTNLFVSANLHENCFLLADRKNAYDWETFLLENLDNNKIAIKASNGKYVSVDQSLGGLLVANKDSIGNWEKFTLVENP